MKYYILIVLVCLFISGCKQNKHHIVKEFYENGKLKSEVEYVGRYPNGTGRMYYPNGNLWKLVTYKDGKLHGKSYVYHKNGKVDVEQNYKNGLLDGKSFVFSADGKKIEETDWANGHSSFGRSFYKDGDTLSVRRGDKVITYYKTKKIAVIACVEGNDKLIGRIKFSADGSVIKQEGILTCLTRNDTLRLNAQNPDWKKYKNNL